MFGGQWEGMADRRAARDDSTARGNARRGARGREPAGTAPALARVLVSALSPSRQTVDVSVRTPQATPPRLSGVAPLRVTANATTAVTDKVTTR